MPFQPAIDEPSNAWPRLELVHRELLGRHRNVLLLAAGVREAKVDELDLLFLEHLEDVGGGRHGILLWKRERKRLMRCEKWPECSSQNYAIRKRPESPARTQISAVRRSR